MIDIIDNTDNIRDLCPGLTLSQVTTTGHKFTTRNTYL